MVAFLTSKSLTIKRGMVESKKKKPVLFWLFAVFVEAFSLGEGFPPSMEIFLSVRRAFPSLLRERSFFGEALPVFMIMEIIVFLEMRLSLFAFFASLMMLITFLVIRMEGTFFSRTSGERFTAKTRFMETFAESLFFREFLLFSFCV